MKYMTHRPCRVSVLLSGLAVGALLALGASRALASLTIYSDSFESYPVQNPAPSPLTNGPAGGQWFFVAPIPLPITFNEQQILNNGSLGAGFYSKVWASLTNNARLTNAISVSVLPAVVPPYKFRLSFITAADTTDATRSIAFNYAITSSASDLAFVSGQNLDGSQILGGLAGSGVAPAGTTGKSNNRRFEFIFTSSLMTTADTITFDFTRVTNSTGAALNVLLDDVQLTVDDANPPKVLSLTPVLTLQHVRVNFSEQVDPASATNMLNYSFVGGALTVQNASLVSPGIVELWTSAQAPGTSYTLQVTNVLGESGISMTTTQMSFTTPALTISPIRYDAGTTTTQPAGPLDPSVTNAGYWTKTVPVAAGFSMAPVTDDLGSGLNSWSITDSTTAAGNPTCVIPMPQPASVNLGTNGWRLITVSRLADNFGTTASDQFVLFFNPGIRYGLSWGADISGSLWLGSVGGVTYIVSPNLNGFHTNIMVYNPVTKAAAIYFDGQLITDSYTGQALAGSGLTFGGVSTAGKGQMNYNLVQLDVIGATAPSVAQSPPSTTNGVGQKVTFIAAFNPYVNTVQWYSNDVAIAGATATNYTTSFINSGYNGSQFRCRTFSALGDISTAAAVLTVTDDTNPPVIIAAAPSPIIDRIMLTFSEPVQEAYSTNLANFSWVNPGVTNIAARMLDSLTLELRAGPFVQGSNYTVRVSNVRDTSNLIIVSNSPATVVFPTLGSVARYDAGNTTTAPSGPPDPVSPQGGSWILPPFTDPGLSTNAIFDDNATGLNAWQVRDASTTIGAFITYSLNIATNLQDAARQSGFVLSVRSRIAENFGNGPALFAFWEDYKNGRSGFGFNADANNNLVLGLAITNGFTNYVLTADSSALDAYHLYQAAFDPVTRQVSYYYDSNWVATLPFSTTANSIIGLVWGSLASAGEGTVNFNLVDLSAVNPPFVTVTPNGANMDVAYRGILQTATQLVTGPIWTTVATNAGGGTNIYSLPRNQSPRYFRTQLPR